MDRTGYDIFWLAEHHFHPKVLVHPAWCMRALHLCHLTRNPPDSVRFNIAAMWHPLRMAKDFATVDWLTVGRVRVRGSGSATHPRRSEAFGPPLLDQPPPRAVRGGRSIQLQSFNQRAFSRQGKHYTIPAAVPYRCSISGDHPGAAPERCRSSAGSRWSASPRAIDFMAKHDIPRIIVGARRRWSPREGGPTLPGGPPRAGREGSRARPLHRSRSTSRQRRPGNQSHPVLRGTFKMFAPLGFVPGLTPSRSSGRAPSGRVGEHAAPCARGFKRDWLDRPAGAHTRSAHGYPAQVPRARGRQRRSSGGHPQAVILEQLERLLGIGWGSCRPSRARLRSQHRDLTASRRRTIEEAACPLVVRFACPSTLPRRLVRISRICAELSHAVGDSIGATGSATGVRNQ